MVQIVEEADRAVEAALILITVAAVVVVVNEAVIVDVVEVNTEVVVATKATVESLQEV